MTLDGKKILVTGASGLIGFNLVQRLKKLPNAQILAAIHNKNIELGADIVRIDLLNSQDCGNITENIDVVFHCAANSSGAKAHSENPTAMSKDNTIMNLNLLDACYKNHVKKFVWLASTTGYPDSNQPMKEEEMFVGDPFDKYFAVGWMKRYTEKMCEMYATKVNNPMTCIVLRPTNIYGPNDKIEPDRSHVLTALIRKVVEKQNPIQVWGDGTDIRDVLYVDDMVDAMILSAETVEGFKQYNVGYGAAFSVLELLNYIKKVENIHVDHVLVPTAPRMIPIRKVSIEKINKELGWYPKTPLTLGIQKTYDWDKHVLSV